MSNEATNVKMDTTIAGQVTATWAATPDEGCVGWRLTARMLNGTWAELARTSDPGARSLVGKGPAGTGPFHLMALVKGPIAEGVGTIQGTSPAPPPPPPPPPPSGATFFSDLSPFNIPARAAVLDPSSGSMAAAISGSGCSLLMHEFGSVVMYADGTAPSKVRVLNHWAGFYEGLVPFPKAAHASVGSDGAAVVVDRANGVAYDFWQLTWNGSEWVAGYCSKFSITGDGCPGHGATGSDIPLLACLTLASEIKAGHIPHTISIATSQSAAAFRFPAFKSDGHGGYPPAVPEGTRFILPPSVDVTKLGLPPGGVTFARALQERGAIVRNTSGSKIAIGCEDVGPIQPGNPYYDAGLTHDYFNLSAIPWDLLVAARKWDMLARHVDTPEAESLRLEHVERREIEAAGNAERYEREALHAVAP